jgi:hypothetical protein
MKPYVSFVVAARNDNYAGDFLYRMHLFLNTLAALSHRHGLHAELVVVEWNPPADRPRLKDAVHWPRGDRGLSIRIIEVPEDVHRTLRNAEKMPIFEYIAKNVGIRRAHGEFVLVTNPDIIFSDELIARLAQGNLPADCYGKADRYDVEKRVPADAPVDEMLRFCRRHVVRIWNRDVPTDPRWRARAASYASRVRAFMSGPNPARVVRWLWRTLNRRNAVRYNVSEAKPWVLHFGAPGDFLLLGRQKWHELRGFPELPTHSHIDTYLVYLASAAGLRQLVLPHRIYHMEHDRSAHATRPLVQLNDMPGFREMFETHRPVITNGDNWGLGGVVLPECALPCSNDA